MATRRSLLFSPYRLREVEFPNRIILSPMQMYVAGDDGIATDWHYQHLAKFAVSGVGCVFTEVLPPDPVGRNTHWDLGIWDEAQVAPLARIAGFIKESGSIPAAQMGHAGVKASRQRPSDGLQPLGTEDTEKGEPPWQPVGPVTATHVQGYHPPHELTTNDIHELIDKFGEGANRLDRAGFEFLEVHAAHGYLIHSFYSPISNTRTDGYGGSLKNRMRFALEVAESIRGRWPEKYPLSFRISAIDAVEGGWALEDSAALSTALGTVGVDIIDCSSRGVGAANSLTKLEKAGKSLDEGYQVPYAEFIRKNVGMPTIAVGLITRAQHAEAILQQGCADFIAIAREFLYNPHWALHAAEELEPESAWEDWPPTWSWWLERRNKLGINKVD